MIIFAVHVIIPTTMISVADHDAMASSFRYRHALSAANLVLPLYGYPSGAMPVGRQFPIGMPGGKELHMGLVAIVVLIIIVGGYFAVRRMQARQ